MIQIGKVSIPLFIVILIRIVIIRMKKQCQNILNDTEEDQAFLIWQPIILQVR